MTQPRILITGGTGFAGSHLIEHLLSQNYSDLHATHHSRQLERVSQLLVETQIHPLELTNFSAVSQLLSSLRPTQIYHLAAISTVGDSFDRPQEVISTNTQIQLNLLVAVKDIIPDTKILVVGSAQEYDVIAHQSLTISETHPLGPTNPYGVSKVTQDLLALSFYYAYRLPILRVRPFNHIGERQPLGFAVADFAHQIVEIERGRQTQIKVGNLAAIRDFTDVKDMVAAYQLVMDLGRPGEVYNIGSGQGLSMQIVLDKLVKLARVPIEVVVDTDRLRPLDSPKIVADCQFITDLGWKPQHRLEETLARILDYWRSQQ